MFIGTTNLFNGMTEKNEMTIFILYELLIGMVILKILRRFGIIIDH